MKRTNRIKALLFRFRLWVYGRYYGFKRFLAQEPLLTGNFLEVSVRLPVRGFLYYKTMVDS